MIFDPHKITSLFNLKGSYNNPPKMSGLNLTSCCPFPHFKEGVGLYYEKKPSFGINLESQAWNCYSCGRKGFGLDNLAKQLSIDIPIIFKSIDPDVGNLKNTSEYQEIISDYNLKMFEINQEYAEEYLAGRGINGTVKMYHIGMSKKRDKLYMPLINREQSLYGWIERNMTGNVKYLMQPKGIDKDNVLYGEHVVTKRHGIFVESPMDVLKAYTFGDDALASCSANIKPQQLEYLLEFFDKIYLVPHNDEPGTIWLNRCIYNLRGRCLLYLIKLPEHRKDLAEVETEEEFLSIARNARIVR
jgi:DNA primase